MLAHCGPDRSKRPAPARGLGGVEVLVITALVGFLVLCVLIVLPRGREAARMASCQHNLRQLGMATLHYDQVHRHFPTSPAAGHPEPGDSPVAAMLAAFVIPDFLEFGDPTRAPKATQAPGRETRVAGLVCPSDSLATGRPAALSYRANAGDEVDGRTGPFAPGMPVASATVEAADGLGHTAGFAERLIGTGRDGEPGAMNFALVTGPVTAPCDLSAADDRRWRGGAGASWAEPGWRSALYSHVVPPNAPTSCIAEDGVTATMTASSAHPGRINVWMLDGSLRGITPTIHPPIWRAMGSIGTPAPPIAEPAR